MLLKDAIGRAEAKVLESDTQLEQFLIWVEDVKFLYFPEDIGRLMATAESDVPYRGLYSDTFVKSKRKEIHSARVRLRRLVQQFKRECVVKS